MKAIAYNITSFEKETLILVNHKKHEFAFIAEKLSIENAYLASGKDVLLIFPNDVIGADILPILKESGIRYLACTTVNTDHIDRKAAGALGFKISNIPAHTLNGISDEDSLRVRLEQVVKNLDLWGKGKCVGKACACMNSCAKKAVEL